MDHTHDELVALAYEALDTKAGRARATRMLSYDAEQLDPGTLAGLTDAELCVIAGLIPADR